jgi:hypothetical protein
MVGTFAHCIHENSNRPESGTKKTNHDPRASHKERALPSEGKRGWGANPTNEKPKNRKKDAM